MMVRMLSVGGLKPLCLTAARAGVFAAAFAAAMLLPASGALAQGTPAGDVSGVWWGVGYSPNLEIQGGGEYSL